MNDDLKIVPISTKLESSLAISIVDTLKDALKDIEEKNREASNCIVLFLNRNDDKYHIGWHLAGLSCSEAVALLEVAKQEFMRQMGY